MSYGKKGNHGTRKLLLSTKETCISSCQYIKIRTQRISLLLKKRFTTPNWIKLGAIGREVKQILPQGLRRHRRSNSNGSTASVQYPKGQEPAFGNPSSKVQAKS